MSAVHMGGTSSRPQPSPEQLALAWRHINRPGAPATLEAALAHRTWGPCIRSLALSLSRRGIEAAAPAAVVPLRPAPPAYRPLRLGTFDPKRAAANDKD